MIHAIAVSPLLNVARTRSPTFGGQIRQFLFGRVFVNWKDSILVASAVYLVASAVLSFFTGAWIAAFAEFFIGGTLATIRKEYREFTNLRNVTGQLSRTAGDLQYENFRYGRENDEHKRQNQAQAQENAVYRAENATHAANNALYRHQVAVHAANNALQAQENEKLRASIDAFREQIALLNRERLEFEKQNAQFRGNNQLLSVQMRAMEYTLREASRQIDHTAANAESILRSALEAFDSKKLTLSAMVDDQRRAQNAAEQKWARLYDDVGKMNAQGVRILHDANNRLQVTLQQLAARQAEKATLEEEITALRGEIDRLQKTNDSLIGTASKLRLHVGQLGHEPRQGGWLGSFF